MTRLNAALDESARTTVHYRSIRIRVLKYSMHSDTTAVPNKVAMAELIAKYIPAFERYVPAPRSHG